MTRLTDHFTLEELTYSGAAARLGIANDPSIQSVANLLRLARVLEMVRALLGYNQILIHSGYRSEKVNERVGGVPNSAHLTGCAVDFVAPGYGSPFAIAQAIKLSTIVYDQLILEYGWVHLAIAAEGQDPRLQTLTKRDFLAPYEKGLNV